MATSYVGQNTNVPYYSRAWERIVWNEGARASAKYYEPAFTLHENESERNSSGLTLLRFVSHNTDLYDYFWNLEGVIKIISCNRIGVASARLIRLKQGWEYRYSNIDILKYWNCFQWFFEYRNIEIQAKPISVLYRNTEIQAKPISVLYRNTEIQAKPISELYRNTEIQAKPISVLYRYTEVQAKPISVFPKLATLYAIHC